MGLAAGHDHAASTNPITQSLRANLDRLRSRGPGAMRSSAIEELSISVQPTQTTDEPRDPRTAHAVRRAQTGTRGVVMQAPATDGRRPGDTEHGTDVPTACATQRTRPVVEVLSSRHTDPGSTDEPAGGTGQWTSGTALQRPATGPSLRYHKVCPAGANPFDFKLHSFHTLVKVESGQMSAFAPTL